MTWVCVCCVCVLCVCVCVCVWGGGIALRKIFIKPNKSVRLGNNEVLKNLKENFKIFKILRPRPQGHVMTADGADKSFWPVSVLIPNRN